MGPGWSSQRRGVQWIEIRQWIAIKRMANETMASKKLVSETMVSEKMASKTMVSERMASQ
jgi:hypothetical protein